jgi:hypothetical protein
LHGRARHSEFSRFDSPDGSWNQVLSRGWLRVAD